MPTVTSSSPVPYDSQRIVAERTTYTVDTWQDLWPGPTDRIPFVDTPQNLELVSANAANAAAGTGAQQVRLGLLDANMIYNEILVELNGITAVPVPGGPYLRCNRFETVRTGSYGWVEAGAVDLRQSGGGAVWRRMIVDSNEDRSGAYTVPARFETSVSSFVMKMYGRTASSALDVEAQVREPGEAWRVLGLIRLDDVDNGTGGIGDDQIRGKPGTDFRISAYPTGTPGRCVANVLLKEYTIG